MKSLRFIALASLFAAAFLAPAKASIVITAIESGGNVVFSFSGSVDLTGATTPGGTSVNSAINPTIPLVYFGGTSSDTYTLANPDGVAFGSGGGNSATVANTGDLFVYVSNATSPRIEVPDGYISGSAISGSMTFNSATFASLGISPVPATYIWDMQLAGTGTVAQTVTLNVIPEPSTFALIGLAGFGLLRRRRCLLR